jgi:hypothetical protein
MADVLMIGMIVLVLGFVFFVYLMLRRTALGFKEGVDKGKR